MSSSIHPCIQHYCNRSHSWQLTQSLTHTQCGMPIFFLRGPTGPCKFILFSFYSKEREVWEREREREMTFTFPTGFCFVFLSKVKECAAECRKRKRWPIVEVATCKCPTFYCCLKYDSLKLMKVLPAAHLIIIIIIIIIIHMKNKKRATNLLLKSSH